MNWAPKFIAVLAAAAIASAALLSVMSKPAEAGPAQQGVKKEVKSHAKKARCG